MHVSDLLGEGLPVAGGLVAAVEQPPAAHAGPSQTWLACDEHLASLSEFLAARDFLRDVEPVGGQHDGDGNGEQPTTG